MFGLHSYRFYFKIFRYLFSINLTAIWYHWNTVHETLNVLKILRPKSMAGNIQTQFFRISFHTVSNMNSDLKAIVLLLLLTLFNELKIYVLHFNTERMTEYLSVRWLPTRVESKQVATSICLRNAAFRGMTIRKLESWTHFTVCEHCPKDWPFDLFPSLYTGCV